jgi:hypothetical protein
MKNMKNLKHPKKLAHRIGWSVLHVFHVFHGFFMPALASACI